MSSKVKDVPSILDESKQLKSSKDEPHLRGAKKVATVKKPKIIGQKYIPNPMSTASIKYPEVLHNVLDNGDLVPATVKRKQEGHKSISQMTTKEFGTYSLELAGQYVDTSKPKSSMSWARRVSGFKR